MGCVKTFSVRMNTLKAVQLERVLWMGVGEAKTLGGRAHETAPSMSILHVVLWVLMVASEELISSQDINVIELRINISPHTLLPLIHLGMSICPNSDQWIWEKISCRCFEKCFLRDNRKCCTFSHCTQRLRLIPKCHRLQWGHSALDKTSIAGKRAKGKKKKKKGIWNHWYVNWRNN